MVGGRSRIDQLRRGQSAGLPDQAELRRPVHKSGTMAFQGRRSRPLQNTLDDGWHSFAEAVGRRPRKRTLGIQATPDAGPARGHGVRDRSMCAVRLWGSDRAGLKSADHRHPGVRRTRTESTRGVDNRRSGWGQTARTDMNDTQGVLRSLPPAGGDGVRNRRVCAVRLGASLRCDPSHPFLLLWVQIEPG